MAKKKTGICKLTGKTGKFIDAHLIPKALTKPDVPGAPIIQYGAGGRPKKKWSSWKDDELVVQDGENILTESDTWAIPTLRRHQLVWSAWRRGMLDADDWTRMPGTNVGIRKIEGIDTRRLRLFFLSLLWRAAATSREGFDVVQLPPPDLEALGQMLVSKKIEPLTFYPIELIQLSTLGTIHNHTPIMQTKKLPDFGQARWLRPLGIVHAFAQRLWDGSRARARAGYLRQRTPPDRLPSSSSKLLIVRTHYNH